MKEEIIERMVEKVMCDTDEYNKFIENSLTNEFNSMSKKNFENWARSLGVVKD
jgi:hypothetical protein